MTNKHFKDNRIAIHVSDMYIKSITLLLGAVHHNKNCLIQKQIVRELGNICIILIEEIGT